MIEQVAKAYTTARTRLLLFDYDGVLAPIVDLPEQAGPTDELLALLREISTQPGTKVVVISGRDDKSLEQWLGELPIDMSVEHGHFIKESGEWRRGSESDMEWQTDVRGVMEQLVLEYPGSHIETKRAGLVWHYRQAHAQVDEQDAARRIAVVLQDRAVLMASKCALDIRAHGADKGSAAQHWYDQRKWDFVLCVGDDVTDEAMFRALPLPAWTIKVGIGTTAARYSFDAQQDVNELLRVLSRRL